MATFPRSIIINLEREKKPLNSATTTRYPLLMSLIVRKEEDMPWWNRKQKKKTMIIAWKTLEGHGLVSVMTLCASSRNLWLHSNRNKRTLRF
ncbi:hypothetical protein TNCV_3002381 [Trichonephila clavipes]|nr:hypothetical protein TNCV_3002381 [Trichonephila clavipes]